MKPCNFLYSPDPAVSGDTGPNPPTSGSDTNITDDTSTDDQGWRLLDTGTWNGSATLSYQGGQGMHFQVKNVNVLGTTLSIHSNLGGDQSQLIGPGMTLDLTFSCFGSEPMGWTFDISSDSDAFIVAWRLFSTWLPGDPPNG
jgi:hypothetical protein